MLLNLLEPFIPSQFLKFILFKIKIIKYLFLFEHTLFIFKKKF